LCPFPEGALRRHILSETHNPFNSLKLNSAGGEGPANTLTDKQLCQLMLQIRKLTWHETMLEYGD